VRLLDALKEFSDVRDVYFPRKYANFDIRDLDPQSV
jgi:hypothetical protein